MSETVNAQNHPSNGMLLNLQKRFLKFADNTARDVNAMRDESNLTHACKAMIRCAFAKQLSGLWEVRSLFLHLENNILLYRENFEGFNPDSD